jgi:uncharacterized protein YjdB
VKFVVCADEYGNTELQSDCTTEVRECEHEYEYQYTEVEVTCREKGKEIRKCKYCGKVKEFTVYTSSYIHKDSDLTKKIVEPTCTVDGYSYYQCKYCGKWITDDTHKEETIKATGHKYSSWITLKKASALEYGYKIRKCSTCQNEDTKIVSPLKAKVTLKKSSVTIKKKGAYTLKIKSKTYGDKISKWVSKNKKIATVNSKGKVTGKKKGTTTITLQMKSGAKATCKVKVK